MIDSFDTEQQRKLVSVRINGLFESLSYSIPLNTESGITILIGPNGCGKTTILSLIEAFLTNSLRTLIAIPYRELVFSFDDETEIALTRRDSSKQLMRRNPSNEERRNKILNLKFRPVRTTVIGGKDENAQEPGEDGRRNEYELEYVMRRSDGSQLEKPYTTAIFRSDMKEEEEYFRHLTAERLSLPDWLEAFEADFCAERIGAERLQFTKPTKVKRLKNFQYSYYSGEKANAQVVVDNQERFIVAYRHQYIERIGKMREIMAIKAQELAQSFPLRIVERGKLNINISTDELRTRLEKIAEKRQRLKAMGILPHNDSETVAVCEDIEDATRMLLLVSAEDEEVKLGLVDELLQKAELFVGIINSRLVNKKLVLSDKSGLTVINSYDGSNLSLHLLSSGEEQEITLFFKLIFLVSPGSLVLIDEPELSMHIGWQLHFVDDLKKVRGLTGCDYILATHSPAIIDDHWDYVVELEV